MASALGGKVHFVKEAGAWAARVPGPSRFDAPLLGTGVRLWCAVLLAAAAAFEAGALPKEQLKPH